MLIQDLPIPDNLKQRYIDGWNYQSSIHRKQNVSRKECLTGKNLLVAIPTASGKTLVAEMAMHQPYCKRG